MKLVSGKNDTLTGSKSSLVVAAHVTCGDTAAKNTNQIPHRWKKIMGPSISLKAALAKPHVLLNVQFCVTFAQKVTYKLEHALMYHL